MLCVNELCTKVLKLRKSGLGTMLQQDVFNSIINKTNLESLQVHGIDINMENKYLCLQMSTAENTRTDKIYSASIPVNYRMMHCVLCFNDTCKYLFYDAIST